MRGSGKETDMFRSYFPTGAGIVVIEESDVCRGLPMLKCIAKRWQQDGQIFLRLADTSVDQFMEGMNCSNVTVVPPTSPYDNLDIVELKTYLKSPSISKSPRGIVIDSLMPFILTSSISHVATQLNLIVEALKCPLISIVSGNVLSRLDLAQLKHICSCWVQLTPTSDSPPNCCVCRFLGKKPSGKPYEQLHQLEVTADFEAVVTTYKEPSTQPPTTSSSAQLPVVSEAKRTADAAAVKPFLPASLTFNLNVSPAEMDARSQNGNLPYMEMQKRGKETSSSAAQIVYVADEADDFDEEDPDDDLDL